MLTNKKKNVIVLITLMALIKHVHFLEEFLFKQSIDFLI